MFLQVRHLRLLFQSPTYSEKQQQLQLLYAVISLDYVSNKARQTWNIALTPGLQHLLGGLGENNNLKHISEAMLFKGDLEWKITFSQNHHYFLIDEVILDLEVATLHCLARV